tara:strand:+ start:163 stop:966 length:804 start_codon:yes stop_codon:yes gene_type:complete
MATTAGDIYVRSGNTGAFTKATFVQGGWITVDSGSTMHNIDESRVAEGQIVYVQDTNKTYVVSKFEAFSTPGYAGYVNSRSFAEFTFPGTGGGGGSSTVGNLTDVTTGSLSNGQVLQWNSSTSKWEASNVSGTGDISAVFAGDGLSGGGTAGSVSLDVLAGQGINLTGGNVNINTGSTHFIQGAIDQNVFQATGSVWNTTKAIGITGSLTLRKDNSNDALSVYSGSVKSFGITGDGLLRLVSQSSTPTPVAGTMYLDSNYDLYIGQE